nr:hypothetical protein [Saprospiraceae bacterium]
MYIQYKGEINKCDLIGKLFKIILTFLLIFVICAVTLNAQVRLQDPEKHQESFIDKVWFGGNVNLGFQGSNTYNVFYFGISPMAGYKFTENFSAGPRFEILYTYYKAFVWNEQRNYTAHPISFSAGAFVRHKFLQQFFGHLEYNVERAKFPLRNFQGNFFSEDGNLATGTITFDNLYIGLGYSSGGKFGSEISILYNVLEPDDSLNIPISIRIGFNYNF